ncbi:hypothetical protein LR48_Vigan09g130000 [Vigna angularis]|uniref:ALOG domain-containing protein n=1 Tax=Phaseolus angularis TaxID=3914 RepID=A0A0L9VC48_PHAAN|nr:hypothetical protein LR48_Vigan09g130000 [Vigna angularis]
MDSSSGGSQPQPPSTTEPTAPPQSQGSSPALPPPPPPPSRYESQKRRDWNTFFQYLHNHKPPLTLARCSGAHVIEFLKYLDQFGKTKVHMSGAAYEENGGRPESNPFGAKAVMIYLKEVKEGQAKARGVPYEKKKRKRSTTRVSKVSDSGAATSIVLQVSANNDSKVGVDAASSASLPSSTTTTTTA